MNDVMECTLRCEWVVFQTLVLPSVAALLLFGAVSLLLRPRRLVGRMPHDLKACRCPFYTHLWYPQPDCPVHGVDRLKREEEIND